MKGLVNKGMICNPSVYRSYKGVMETRLSALVKVIILAFGLLSLVINLSANNASSAALAAAASILVSLYLLVSARANKGLLIVFGYLFLSVYSSCIVNYFGMEIFSPYQQWVGTPISFISINVLLLFLICIAVVFPLKTPGYPTRRLVQDDRSSNGVVVAICAVSFLLCGVFGVGSASATSDRYGITPIYEYSMVFLIVGLYFGGNRKDSVVVFTILSIIRIVIDFAIGSRVTSAAILSIWYLMVFAPRVKARHAVPLLAVVFIAMLTVGELRGSGFTISAVIDGIADYFQAGYAWDGAYAAYHTSESMVAYRELAISDPTVFDFGNYLVSLVTGVSGGHVELQREMSPLFWNMGGGYLPFFFYYYSGYTGVAAASLLVGVLLRSFALCSENERDSDIGRFVFVWVCATSFRWLSYSVSPLVRGLLLVAVVFFALGVLAKVKPVLISKRDGIHG